MDLDILSIIIRWIGLAAIFLLLTYFFRDRVTLEGFWGYVILLLVLVPINIFEPLHEEFFKAIHAPEAVVSNSAGHKSASDADSDNAISDDSRSIERRKSVMYLAILLPFNLMLMFLWCRLLPGLTITGWWAPVVFALILSACALGLSLLPPIPITLG